jgi:hypothetical protein
MLKAHSIGVWLHHSSDVNKDFNAKAKAKAWTLKAKAKAKT